MNIDFSPLHAIKSQLYSYVKATDTILSGGLRIKPEWPTTNSQITSGLRDLGFQA